MAAIALRSEERIGLGLALAAHAALVAWLALSPPAPAPLPPPERMTVTLSEDVGLTATAPALDEAPVLGEVAPIPQPQPAAVAPPKPQPAPPRAVPAPAAKVAPQPPRVAPAKVAPARPAPVTTRPAGASRIGSDFLKGVSGAQGTARTAAPAAAFGPQQQSALRAAIMRQLKPNWSAPQGADAEKLVTQVRFNLNRSGALVGDPQVIAQSGQTPANAAQVRLHAERAIRAVRLAAPFILPPDLYDHWQTVTSTFDRRLSQ
ncbi:TonB C-terminal domain-containing protein [Novosphingobium aquiterrae]|uniref:TonB C-terminal domain-containing protein n=1 Tax=Novosphingobium aquiterrae TaxID=624388 RepID=A0ABV6PGE6_9SPHN